VRSRDCANAELPKTDEIVSYSLSDDLSRKLVQLQSEMELSTLYDDEQLRRSGESPSALRLPRSTLISPSLHSHVPCIAGQASGALRPRHHPRTTPGRVQALDVRFIRRRSLRLHVRYRREPDRVLLLHATAAVGDRQILPPAPILERVIFRAFRSQGTFFHGPFPSSFCALRRLLSSPQSTLCVHRSRCTVRGAGFERRESELRSRNEVHRPAGVSLLSTLAAHVIARHDAAVFLFALQMQREAMNGSGERERKSAEARHRRRLAPYMLVRRCTVRTRCRRRLTC
jgi:hypothetical protein